MNNGWIKIHRKIREKGYYKDSHYVHLWFHILLKANHKNKEFLFNGKILNIKRGQFVTGRKELSFETGINESKVERILKLFESEQQIEQQMNSKNRVITILSYDKYQDDEQQMNNKRTASEQQVNTNNNVKNIKNEKKEDEILEIINYFNKATGGKVKGSVPVFKAITKKLKDYSVQEICKAMDNMLADSWWHDIFKKDISKIFREKDTKGNDVDRIYEFSTQALKNDDFYFKQYEEMGYNMFKFERAFKNTMSNEEWEIIDQKILNKFDNLN